MKRQLPRIGLLSLLAMPTMFALGWWSRGLNYSRDVYAAAEKIPEDSGGVFIPELGVVHGRKRFSDRYNAMSPAAKAEMERRLAYYTDVIEPTFDPPKPGIIESVASLFSGANESPQRADGVSTTEEQNTTDTAEIRPRMEFFRQMRDESRDAGFSSGTQE